MINLLSSKITATHTFPAAEMYSSVPLSDYFRHLHTIIDSMFETWPKAILPLKSCSSKDMTRYVNNALEAAGERFADIDVTARIHLATEGSHIQILAEDDLGIIDVKIRVDIERVSNTVTSVLNTLAKDIQERRKFLPGGVVYSVPVQAGKLDPDTENEVITIRKNRLIRPAQPSKDVLDFYYGVHKIKGVDYDGI